MNDQPLFVHDRLSSKLAERLAEALTYINSISQEDVLRCDGGCLTEIVRQFAIAPPILRQDLMVADEDIGEQVDSSFERKTGRTNHFFFIPIEREAEWLGEVDRQVLPVDGAPLAFLDRNRARISIKITVSPEDAEGELRRKLEYRAERVEDYARSVSLKLIEFNENLAEEMLANLNKRKSAILRAVKELDLTGLPRVLNPEHEERAIQMGNLLRGLGLYMAGSSTAGSSHGELRKREVHVFIVRGHDHQSLLELKDYIQNTLQLGEPTVLRQMPGLGRTLIEKFEVAAETVELVFVLLTPDDKVADPSEPDIIKRRARQNVIFELGFFLGRLGRKSGRILLLHKGPVEVPSDINGIEYIDITNGIEGSGERIRRELKALGALG